MSTTTADDLMRYESGDMPETEALVMFADLVKTGMAWQLQGSYGRAAANLIEAGLIDPEGNLTERAADLIVAEV